jgi:hypothetical protein
VLPDVDYFPARNRRGAYSENGGRERVEKALSVARAFKSFEESAKPIGTVMKSRM